MACMLTVLTKTQPTNQKPQIKYPPKYDYEWKITVQYIIKFEICFHRSKPTKL